VFGIRVQKVKKEPKTKELRIFALNSWTVGPCCPYDILRQNFGGVSVPFSVTGSGAYYLFVFISPGSDLEPDPLPPEVGSTV
jgi:hypothetical protein